MSNSSSGDHKPDITFLLRQWSQGSDEALSQLVPYVYEELRSRAHYYMRHENPGHILQTTGLVNEVYLRLVGLKGIPWQDRVHFYALSARLMRRVLTDIARHDDTQKGPGGKIHVPFEDAKTVPKEWDFDVIAMDEALDDLAAEDERKCKVVELRFYGGRSVEETAGVLGVSPETVKRDFRFARSWLRRRLDEKKDPNEGKPAEG